MFYVTDQKKNLCFVWQIGEGVYGVAVIWQHDMTLHQPIDKWPFWNLVIKWTISFIFPFYGMIWKKKDNLNNLDVDDNIFSCHVELLL